MQANINVFVTRQTRKLQWYMTGVQEVGARKAANSHRVDSTASQQEYRPQLLS